MSGTSITAILLSIPAVAALIWLGDYFAAGWAEFLFKPRDQSLRDDACGDWPAVPTIDAPRFHDLGGKL